PRSNCEEFCRNSNPEGAGGLVTGNDRPGHCMHLRSALSPGSIALHAARIGCRAAVAAFARSRGEPALGPARADLDDMAPFFQLLDARLGRTIFQHQHTRASRTRPERDREMFRMPRRRIDRFLQVHLAVGVPEEELRRPLVLLIAARRTPRQIGFTVAQRERRAERRAWTLAGCKTSGVLFVEPECLRARAEAKAEFGDDRR